MTNTSSEELFLYADHRVQCLCAEEKLTGLVHSNSWGASERCPPDASEGGEGRNLSHCQHDLPQTLIPTLFAQFI